MEFAVSLKGGGRRGTDFPVESVRACRFTPLQLNFAASWLRDGERFIARGPGSVNGDGAVVHNAIPDADVRRGAVGVVVSGEGDATGLCCCGSSNDAADGGRNISVGNQGSGVRVIADCGVAVGA